MTAMVARPLPPRGLIDPGRRRFVQGLAAAGAAASIGGPLSRALAGPFEPGVLAGSDLHLEIGPVPVNVTGRPRIATGVNGSMPGPLLRWREGDTVTIAVTNRLDQPSSIHWHGIRAPAEMDGVPGLSFAGIAPGETFVYRLPLRQSGTYWYHSHSGFQEQTGLHGAIVIEPAAGYADTFDRDYVVLLADWSDDDPDEILSNLKMQSDYYNEGQRTLGAFIDDAGRQGLGTAIADRVAWGAMRMSPTDILDVSGRTYTYLVNGNTPEQNWTGLFRPGERVRLRFINASSMSIFDVRLPGLPMSVVGSDGNDVEPVTVDEFRIGTAETYDVIVAPTDDRAYTILAVAEDHSGLARATLAPAAGMAAPIPPLGPRPMRTIADMGMGGMATGAPGDGAMPDMQMPDMDMGKAPALKASVEVDNVALSPADGTARPAGRPSGRPRVLTYADLKATRRGTDPRPPAREITLHLTGNMQRYIWGFDGLKFSEAAPIDVRLGERVRFVLVNDTMMEHPIHLHGLWSELENGQDEFRPYKHTVLIRPGERVSCLVTADEPGRWAFHCHLLYHMEMGMFRVVRVA